MKKIARELEQLDHDIDSLQLVRGVSNVVLVNKVETFRKQQRTMWNTLSFGTINTNHDKLARLFQDALQYPTKYTRASFLKMMISLKGAHNILAYHFLNSYGDRRNSVEEIIAAFVIMNEKARKSESVLQEKLLPEVAHKASIQDARNKQHHTRKSSLRKQHTRPSIKIYKNIESIINSHTVVVFSKTYCLFSTTAKTLLKKHFPSSNIHIVELDTHPKGTLIQNALNIKTQQDTVPNIFIHQKHIGGYTELVSHIKNKNIQ
jgi:glutaredoxin 3